MGDRFWICLVLLFAEMALITGQYSKDEADISANRKKFTGKIHYSQKLEGLRKAVEAETKNNITEELKKIKAEILSIASTLNNKIEQLAKDVPRLSANFKKMNDTIEKVANDIRRRSESMNKVITDEASSRKNDITAVNNTVMIVHQVYYPPGTKDHAAPISFPQSNAVFIGIGYGHNSEDEDDSVFVGEVHSLERCVRECEEKRRGDSSFNGVQYRYTDTYCFCEKNWVTHHNEFVRYLHYKLF